ncbi:MAG: alpha/beta hydrolase [Phaeodactylibacter sp.]|nr:alpha/beta hydrolase [Phaeodactylibacter sp.]MCB9272585.1 alpha/beta hydrolase [Lewinellaceae bacterium]
MKASHLTALAFLLPFTCFAQKLPTDSMLLISLRKDFDAVDKFSPAPQFRWLDLNTAPDSSMLSTTDVAELIARAKGKRVLLLIHGMNTPAVRAINYYRGVAHWVNGPTAPYDVVFGLLWPGYQLKRSKVQASLAFLKANPSARRSGKKFAGLLQELAGEARSLDIMTHSMGSKVALSALKKQDGMVDKLFLMAPSVGAKTLGKHRKYEASARHVRDKAVVFFSNNDPVFRALGKKMMGYQGMVSKKPLPEDKFLNIDCSEAVYRHSAYWSSQQVFEVLEH